MMPMIAIYQLRCPVHDEMTKVKEGKEVAENVYRVLLECGCTFRLKINVEMVME